MIACLGGCGWHHHGLTCSRPVPAVRDVRQRINHGYRGPRTGRRHRRVPGRRQRDRARGRPGPARAAGRSARGRRGRGLRRPGGGSAGHPAPRAGDRHPHAPGLPAGGHRGRPRGPPALPGHRCGHPVPVRRSRVRHLPGGRGRRRLRLPAQGPHRRGQPAGRCGAGRGHRGYCPRPFHRRCPGPSGHHPRGPDPGRGVPPGLGGRGQAHQGHRRGAADHTRGGRTHRSRRCS